MIIDDDKIVFALVFFKDDKDDKFVSFYGRGNDVSQEKCMDAMFSFLKRAVDSGNKRNIEVLNIVVSAVEGIKGEYPEIKKDIEQNTLR
jgi:hypothetical protein